jgi:hybrid polyketide synthase/nonribosomal peptide synthetase ACE1
LQDFVERALSNDEGADGESNLPCITHEQVAGRFAIDHVGPAVVSWASLSSGVPVQLATVNSQVSFKGDRTYVMFGLTSDMALSICSWMASQGARNIVLTSRCPKVDPEWLELMGKAGVRVEAFAK